MRRLKNRSRKATMQRRIRKNRRRTNLKKNLKNLKDLLPIKARLLPNPHPSHPKSSKFLHLSRPKSLQKNLPRIKVINLIRKIIVHHLKSWHPNLKSAEAVQNKKIKKILR